jgi:hypothetical protein
MGYSTKFWGQFKLDKPVTMAHFAELDRMMAAGFTTGARPPLTDGQPDSYCGWVLNEDGTAFGWDGGEKFGLYVEWLRHLIERYLKPWGYILNGEVDYQGEGRADLGKIRVTENVVTVLKAKVSFEEAV